MAFGAGLVSGEEGLKDREGSVWGLGCDMRILYGVDDCVLAVGLPLINGCDLSIKRNGVVCFHTGVDQAGFHWVGSDNG